MDITAAQINALAPNAAAAKNGRDLAAKGKFSNLGVDSAGAVLWGDCAGSGKTPYSCSADFAQPSAPVFRCSCPSRQFPCKHCLGLLAAYEQGLTFAASDLPPDLSTKREKAAKRQEKREEKKVTEKAAAATKPKKSPAAAVKKLNAQLAGIATASRMLENILRAGFSSLDPGELASLREQVKALGNAYIPGVQTVFSDLLLDVEKVENENYTAAVDRAAYLYVLLKKATAHLTDRKERPLDPPATDSAIEEQIGYVWKLSELSALGRSEKGAALAQLAFFARDDRARRELVEEGVWINLRTGQLCLTRNYRPYKAMKYVKSENSFEGVAEIGELFVYPGDLNPRVRWEPGDLAARPLAPADFAAVMSHASGAYAESFRAVRNSIKSPLADRNPYLLLALHKAWRNGERLVVEDAAGTCLTLRDDPGGDAAAETALGMILSAECAGLALLVRIDNDVREGLFTGQPLSLVCSDKIVRLS